jgi:hypothetical protein
LSGRVGTEALSVRAERRSASLAGAGINFDITGGWKRGSNGEGGSDLSGKIRLHPPWPLEESPLEGLLGVYAEAVPDRQLLPVTTKIVTVIRTSTLANRFIIFIFSFPVTMSDPMVGGML